MDIEAKIWDDDIFRVTPEKLVNQAHLGAPDSKATKVYQACAVHVV